MAILKKLSLSIILFLFFSHHNVLANVEEYTVKAGLILNFARFTTWPQSSTKDNTLLLCIMNSNQSIANSFTKIVQKPVKQYHLQIKILNNNHKLDDCHLLFIAGSERNQLQRLLTATIDKPILTIGEMTDFAQLGGMINLVTINNKIRFKVNLEAILHAGLKLSARILKFAIILRP